MKASDFPYTIERALKLNWGGKSFFTGYIKGASAYDAGKAKTISGIKADDATGKITITLTKPYGAFLNVLAFPSAGPRAERDEDVQPLQRPAARRRALRDQGRRPEPLLRRRPQPGLDRQHRPGRARRPRRHQRQDRVQHADRGRAGAQQLGRRLRLGRPDPAVAGRRRSRRRPTTATAQQNTISTFYFFLNTQAKPFNNQLAREAVNYALDRRALNRLNGGNFTPTCWFLPEGLVGHPTAPCPYGDPNGAPDMAKAKQLVQQSGMAGQPVTVWSETRSPRKEFVAYYTDVLNQLGFKAKSKIIADAQYFATIGNRKSEPQTGFADWNQDFPNPSDFYLLLDANTIQATNNQNFSQVNDPHIQSELKSLNAVPADKLGHGRRALAEARRVRRPEGLHRRLRPAEAPMFFSNRINFGVGDLQSALRQRLVVDRAQVSGDRPRSPATAVSPRRQVDASVRGARAAGHRPVRARLAAAAAQQDRAGVRRAVRRWS